MTNPPSIGPWPQAWSLRNAASNVSRLQARPLVITACVALAFALPTAIPAAEQPNFTDQVLPIFREKCCSCHNPDKKAGGLDLTSWGQTMAGGSSGDVIAPGDAAGSYLFLLASH